MANKKIQKSDETAETNIRVYKSTIPFLREARRREGKSSYARLIDEKFNPTKYVPPTENLQG